MKKKQSFFLYPFQEEKGSVLVMAMMTMAVLTIIGISSLTTSTIEQKIAQNDQLYKIAFYASEAARGYVPPNTNLYHGDNVTEGSGGIHFPTYDGVDNNGDGNIDEPGERFPINSNQSSFDGVVEYNGVSQPPRGSGYEANKFTAHKYKMTCNGYAPRNTGHTVESGFYRIGF